MVAGFAIAFLTAVVGVLLSDSSQWVNRNGELFWVVALSLVAVIVAMALELALGSKGRALPKVALGALLFPLLLGVFTTGTVVPYLGGWGGLELQKLEADADAKWRDLLYLLLLLAVVAGTFFGGVVGLLSWAFRFIPSRRAAKP